MTTPQAAWDNYWQKGHNAACIQQTPEGYGPAINQHWFSLFSSLPADARILDICTGNGAIAALAQRFSREHDLKFDVHGIDAANIAPDRVANPDLAKISFHPNQPLETTPFVDQQFDLVIGQYGLEYTDTDQTLPEIARILRNGGQLQLLLHARDGVTIRAAHQGLKFTRHLLGQNRFLQHTSTYVRSLGAQRSGQHADPREHLRLTKLMNRAARQLHRYASDPEAGPLVHNLLSVTEHMLKNQRHFSEQQMLGKLAELSEHVQLHQQRLLEATAAALGEPQMQDLSQQLQQLGFSVTFSTLIRENDQHTLGWSLHASKSPTQY